MINQYFPTVVASEQALIEALTIEAIGIKGLDVYYIQRNLLTRDMLLNEAVESVFDKSGLIEMYLEDVQGYSGQGFLFSKFGLEIRDQATFVVSKNRWNTVSAAWQQMPRPKEGDLVYVPLTKSFFEIKFVNARDPFYQLANVPVYKLQCELFEHTDEVISTGVTEIDTLADTLMTEFVYDIGNSNSTAFQVGETVTQTIGATTVSGRVLKLEQPTTGSLRIYLGTISNTTIADESLRFSVTGTTVGPTVATEGEMITNFDPVSGTTGDLGLQFVSIGGTVGQLVGSTSGAKWDITKVWDLNTEEADLNFVDSNQQAQNREFELLGDGMIDTTENNPFGNPTQL